MIKMICNLWNKFIMKCNVLEKEWPVSNLGMNIKDLIVKKELEILPSNLSIKSTLGAGTNDLYHNNLTQFHI
jgi:hypothetical protein